MASISSLEIPNQAIGLASGPTSSTLIATLQGNGVACYDTATKRPVNSWPLGSTNVELTSAAVYHPESNRYYVATRPSSSTTTTSRLLSWSLAAAQTGGTLNQIADHIQLPSLARWLLPIKPNTSSSSKEEEAMEIDVEQPAIVVVADSGALSLCGPSTVLSSSLQASIPGSSVLDATLDDGKTIQTIHSDNRTGRITLNIHSIIGSSLRFDGAIELAAPAFEKEDKRNNAAAPVSATCSTRAGRAVVFYADGTIAAFNTKNALLNASSTSGQSIVLLASEFSHTLTGFHTTAAPGNGVKITPSTGKKRTKQQLAIEQQSNTSSCVAVTALGKGGLIAVIGEASPELSSGGEKSVRLVVLDAIYGGIQLVLTLNSSDLAQGGGGFRSTSNANSSTVQTCTLNSSGSTIAILLAGSIYVASLQIQPPTLANVLGALALLESSPPALPLHKQSKKAAKTPSSKTTTTSKAAVAVPSDTASDVNYTRQKKLVSAAQEALGKEGSSRLMLSVETPMGGLIQYSLSESSSSSSQQSKSKSKTKNNTAALKEHHGNSNEHLLSTCAVEWRFPQAERASTIESTAWEALNSSSDGTLSEAQFEKVVKNVFDGCKKARVPVSYEVVCSLLTEASEQGYWNAVDLILSYQKPQSLAACSLVPVAVAAAARYTTLHSLLPGCTDLDADQLAALLKILLSVTESSPQDKATQKAKQNYRNQLKSTADAAVLEAEKAAKQQGKSSDMLAARRLEEATAVARCAVGTVAGFSATQVCLHPVVACQHDPALLLAAVRQLNAAQAVLLLRYLARWIRNYIDIIGDSYPAAIDKPELVVPALNTVLTWAGLTIDGNLGRLMNREEAAAIIGEIQGMVQPQVAALKRLGALKGIVEHIQCKAPIPSAAPVASQYTMEWLDLRIHG